MCIEAMEDCIFLDSFTWNDDSKSISEVGRDDFVCVSNKKCLFKLELLFHFLCML